MKQVKLIKDVGVRRTGEVLNVDENSARSLVEAKKVAVYYDPKKHDAPVERSAPPRGNVTAVAVVEADDPAAPTKRAEKPAHAAEPKSAPVDKPAAADKPGT
jgi:hypothetical protein